MQNYFCSITNGKKHYYCPIKAKKWHLSSHYSFKIWHGDFSTFTPIIVLIVLRNVLSCFLCWVAFLWFCPRSQKPLMVIHHQDGCPYSQGTAVSLLYYSGKILNVRYGRVHPALFLSRLGLGFMGNTMGAFLNTCQAGNENRLELYSLITQLVSRKWAQWKSPLGFLNT